MRWKPGGVSDDVEDRRAESGGGGGGFGVRGPIGCVVVLGLLVLSLLTGRNFLSLLGPAGGGSASIPSSAPARPASPEDNRRKEFVSFVLDDVQKTWEQVLGPRYQHTRVVLFRDGIRSACGIADTADGPFYCPGDHKVYIDLGFFDELRERFGAPGEFAEAYVLAHEIGHHVQSLLGIDERVRAMQERSPALANDLSVRLELQADCLAGVWGHSTAQRNILESGDVESGLAAAAAVGDDRIQRMSVGRVFPEKFTHGSSAQRVQWFKRGLESGEVRSCDSFAGM
jgi:predicted metalloprotease